MYSGQIVRGAWKAFEQWLKSQPDEIQEIGLLDQIDAYYAASRQE